MYNSERQVLPAVFSPPLQQIRKGSSNIHSGAQRLGAQLPFAFISAVGFDPVSTLKTSALSWPSA